MRIVVTGATGFVGSHFAEVAAAAGHEVIALYHSDQSGKKQARDYLSKLGVQLRQANVLDAASLTTAMQGADVVCHFAAAFKESGVDDDYFRRLNVDGTVNALQSAAAAGVRRFVQCSTAGIYGQRVAGIIDESAKSHPWNIYEETKLAAEDQLRTRAPQLGVEYVILRPTAVYGPRDERLVKLFRSAAKGRFPLFGKGEGRRHMVYVKDLAEAFLLACTTPDAASKEMIIGGPKAVSLRELLDLVAQAVDRPSAGPTLPLKPMLLIAALTEDLCKIAKIKPPIYRRRMDFYMNDAEFSSQLAQRVLGWHPKVSLREGLGLTFRSYCAEGAISHSKSSLAALAIAALWSATELSVCLSDSGSFLL